MGILETQQNMWWINIGKGADETQTYCQDNLWSIANWLWIDEVYKYKKPGSHETK